MFHRVEELRLRLKDSGLDAILISQPENRRYLSGFIGTAGHLMVSQDKAILATDFRYTEQAMRQAPNFEVRRTEGDITKWLPKLIAEALPQTLGFEAQDVTYASYQAMLKVLEELDPGQRPSLVPTENLVDQLRAVKDKEELDTISRAIALGDAAFDHVSERIRPGMTEKQVAWEIEKYLRENGGERLSFDTIVASGVYSAVPHHHTSDKPLEAGEPVVIDMGCVMDGYCSDLTRTVFVGAPDDQFKRIYDIVLGAQLTAAATIAAGMTGNDADALARHVIEQAGHGDHFGHSLGHGVGLAVHEFPRLGKGSNDVLADNMVFSIEPGIYITDWGGVRIEDLAVLEEGRVRVLSKARKTELHGR